MPDEYQGIDSMPDKHQGIDSMNLEIEQNKIIDFIRNEIRKAGVDGAVIGISGGIDSALAATLTVKALGKDKVFGIHMPESSLTPSEDSKDAKTLADWLGIEFQTIDISGIISAFMAAIPESESADRLSMGNLKARIRMSLLYFHANRMNRMVIGTGNKTEILLGYFTKYGDGGVDLEPIGGLYKTDVWELSRRLGVPESIITKKPSAGLWAGQTDEAELGISYLKVDEVLKKLEQYEDPETILNTLEISVEQLNSVINRIEKSEHKRSAPQVPLS
ncbi:NAD synthetase [Methanosarcina barkeri 3]|uniref:NH(3)-dependent NAD(+) synthetase n=2 Tax=Methanosarcina barkeri TaxID=2208 RepID=A0A0E3SLH7_METBA|nr:NAD synthetase [Methanosarcina barkeri 3]